MANTVNNKRIAKNTVVLYIRMIVVMAIGFYTARIVLHALGIDDYGLYSVVGGVVGFFSFLSISMTQCTQRFLNYEMAKPGGDVKSVFVTSITVHCLIASLLLLLIETVGLFFLWHYINIPEGRETAAFWVFQTSALALLVTVFTIPYNALVIAHENFNIYAVLGVVDAVLKLGIAFMMLKDEGDRLILYGCLMAIVSIVDFLCYYGYCKKKFVESEFKIIIDKDRIKELFSFTSWRMLGTIFSVIAHYGSSMLVNVFHGVAANAAMGIGSQVNQAVVSLTSNFQTAFTPQITKSYASKDYDQFDFLVFTTSKISFFLLFVVTVPIIFNMDFLLGVWLKEIPQDASVFAILCLIEGVVNAVSTPLDIAIISSGLIKRYQIIWSFASIIQIPFLYFLFYCGLPAYTAIIVKIIITVIVMVTRLYCSKKVASINVFTYSKEVLVPIFIVTAIVFIIGLFFRNISTGPLLTISFTVLLIILSMSLPYFICMKVEERVVLKQLVKKYLNLNKIV